VKETEENKRLRKEFVIRMPRLQYPREVLFYSYKPDGKRDLGLPRKRRREQII
jgi:hypothetical protein